MATLKYYTKEELMNSPSVADGLAYATEAQHRQEGARFIFNLGHRLKLSHDTISCAVIYFHRFYMVYTFQAFSRYVTACGCLLLAGKVEETPKKCKDLIDVTRELLTTEQFAEFGQNPKKEITTLEKILLQTIKFRFDVTNPYNCLLKYAKCLKGDSTTLNSLVQAAWTFINDSLCSTMCLQWEPEIIAVATIYMACLICKFEVKRWVGQKRKHKHWWDMYVEGLTNDFLEGIRKDILGLYEENKAEKVPCKMDSKSSTSSNTPQASPGGQSAISSLRNKSPSELLAKSTKSPPVSLKNGEKKNGIPSNVISPPIPKPGEDMVASTPGDESHTPPGPPPKPKSPRTPPLPAPTEATAASEINSTTSEPSSAQQQAVDGATSTPYVYAQGMAFLPSVEYMASHPPPMGYPPYMYVPTPGMAYPYAPYYAVPNPAAYQPSQPPPDRHQTPPQGWPISFPPQNNAPPRRPPPMHPGMRPMRPPRPGPYPRPPMMHQHHPRPFWRPELYS